jgi:hypothetical protein
MRVCEPELPSGQNCVRDEMRHRNDGPRILHEEEAEEAEQARQAALASAYERAGGGTDDSACVRESECA